MRHDFRRVINSMAIVQLKGGDGTVVSSQQYVSYYDRMVFLLRRKSNKAIN